MKYQVFLFISRSRGYGKRGSALRDRFATAQMSSPSLTAARATRTPGNRLPEARHPERFISVSARMDRDDPSFVHREHVVVPIVGPPDPVGVDPWGPHDHDNSVPVADHVLELRRQASPCLAFQSGLISCRPWQTCRSGSSKLGSR